jgi:hypothetical protein
MGREYSTYGKKSRGAYIVLVEKLEGRRSLGKLRHTWENNIKTDIGEVGGNRLDQSGSG